MSFAEDPWSYFEGDDIPGNHQDWDTDDNVHVSDDDFDMDEDEYYDVEYQAALEDHIFAELDDWEDTFDWDGDDE